MMTEKIEKEIKMLMNRIEAELKNFLQKNPVEKMETIKQRFIPSKSPLNSVVENLIEDLNKYHSFEDSLGEWEDMNKIIWKEIRAFQHSYFETFLYYNVMLILFNSPYSPLLDTHKKELVTKNKLSSMEIKKELLNILGNSFPKELIHRIEKTFWHDDKKLEFLALYNRFHIVIKNARRDLKKSERKIKSDPVAQSKINSKAREEILLRYEIPATKNNLFFSSESAQDLALDWAKESMKINYDIDYLRKVLSQARKIWCSLVKIGLIINYTIEENQKVEFNLIDINFEIGCRFYAVHTRDINRKNLLKYNKVAKKITNSIKDFKNAEEFDGFLVAMI